MIKDGVLRGGSVFPHVQSLMLIVAGCSGLFVNTVVLRYLLHCLGEAHVLIIGR